MAWDVVEGHLSSCGACQRWSDEVRALEAALPRHMTEDAPDPSPAFLARITAVAPTGPAAVASSRDLVPWRVALAFVVVAQLAVGLATVLVGAVAGEHPHLAQELGSWDVALAVGFLFAAWRPARAWGMLPLVAALVTCLVATTVIGLLSGQASVSRESTHALDVAGLGLLWVLARSSRPGPASLRLA